MLGLANGDTLTVRKNAEGAALASQAASAAVAAAHPSQATSYAAQPQSQPDAGEGTRPADNSAPAAPETSRPVPDYQVGSSQAHLTAAYAKTETVCAAS